MPKLAPTTRPLVASILKRAVRETVARQLARRVLFDVCLAFILYCAFHAAKFAFLTLLVLLAIQALLLRRRLRGPFTSARRIENKFHDRAGLLTAALELESSPTSRQFATICMAIDALNTDFYALPPLERDSTLLATEPPLFPTRRACLVLALITLAALPLLFERRDVRLDTSTATNDSLWNNLEAPREQPTIDAIPNQDDAFVDLRERLNKLASIARSIKNELQKDDDQLNFARLASLLSEFKTQRDLRALVGALIAPTPSGDAPSVATVAERLAFERIDAAVERREEDRKAIENDVADAFRANSNSTRQNALRDARERAQNLKNSVVDDATAIAILALRREFLEKDARENNREVLLTFTLDALQNRVGAEPGKEDDETLRIFDEQLEAFGAQLRDEINFSEEFLALCQSPSGRSFVALVHSQVDGKRFQVAPNLMPERANIGLYLDSLRNLARQEHWGALATQLQSARSLCGALAYVGAIANDGAQSASRKIAALLLFEKESFLEASDVARTRQDEQDARLSSSGVEPVDEIVDTPNSAHQNHARDRLTASNANSANEPDVKVDRDSHESVRSRDARSHSSETGGDAPDAQYAGGIALGEQSAPLANDATAFDAELPPTLRVRLEKSKNWRPDPETLKKAKAFRRKVVETDGRDRRHND